MSSFETPACEARFALEEPARLIAARDKTAPKGDAKGCALNANNQRRRCQMQGFCAADRGNSTAHWSARRATPVLLTSSLAAVEAMQPLNEHDYLHGVVPRCKSSRVSPRRSPTRNDDTRRLLPSRPD